MTEYVTKRVILKNRAGEYLLPYIGKLRNYDYTLFCFNSGDIDDNGLAECFSIENNVLTLKAGSVYTTADGVTYEVEEDIVKDLSTLSESGQYFVFINASTEQLEVYQCDLFADIVEPSGAKTNDVWLDVSVSPYACKQKQANGTWLVRNQIVPLPCNPLTITI